MPTKTIRQSATVNATPHEVYEAILDSRKHSKFTGDKAVISRKVGGGHSAFGGYATGKNMELVPDAKIVQSWRASDWPEGAMSQVTYALAAVPAGTRLTFTHSGVPEAEAESIKGGWIEHYWTPLKAMFAKG